jgi:copper chaperone NosL
MTRASSICAVVVLLLIGCGGASDDGPPQVKLGQDECVHCGMILTDERSMAAAIVRKGDEQTALLFDDIGDMIAYEREHAGITVTRRYVHDFETREWLDASTAVFLRSPDLHTPMGSGIVAYGDVNRAKASQNQRGAELHTDLATLVQ